MPVTKKLLLIVPGLLLLAMIPARAVDPAWKIRFELSGGQETPRYQETVDFFQRLDKAASAARLTSFGRSPEGRDLPLFIISADKAFRPEQAARTGKPVVLLQGCIHSGESEGKDALMLLARELLLEGKHREIFERMNLLLVPIFNVDGHEKFSPFNRINQNGPAEMGWRSTAARLNLNRDFMKADAPEMRAWLSMYCRWLPHLFIDCHTTDGMDHQYVITYNIDTHPEFGGAVSRWAGDYFLPAMQRQAAAQGVVIGPYADLLDEEEPGKGLVGGVWRPMLSHVYATLHNRAGFLIETHSLKSYPERVEATRWMILAALQEIADHPQRLTSAVAEEEARVRSWGDGQANPVALDFRTRMDRGDSLLFRGYRIEKRQGAISGRSYPHYTAEPLDTPAIYYDDVEVVESARPPQGYLIPEAWGAIIEVLRIHGIRMKSLIHPWRSRCQGYRCTEVRLRGASYEGRQLADFRLIPVEEERTFPAGTWYVPMQVPEGKLIMNLLEPGAPDALIRWGLLNSIFEEREYFEPYVMEPLAQQMAAADTALAAEFRRRLAADTLFAANPRARLRFFYERTPWFDHDKNLYPIWRVTGGEGMPLAP